MRNFEIKCVSNVFKNGELKTTSTGKQVLNVSPVGEYHFVG